MKKAFVTAVVVLVISVFFALLFSSSSGGSRRRNGFPQTFDEAYKEYQNGNTRPLEGFYEWLEKNP